MALTTHEHKSSLDYLQDVIDNLENKELYSELDEWVVDFDYKNVHIFYDTDRGKLVLEPEYGKTIYVVTMSAKRLVKDVVGSIARRIKRQAKVLISNMAKARMSEWEPYSGSLAPSDWSMLSGWILPDDVNLEEVREVTRRCLSNGFYIPSNLEELTGLDLNEIKAELTREHIESNRTVNGAVYPFLPILKRSSLSTLRRLSPQLVAEAVLDDLLYLVAKGEAYSINLWFCRDSTYLEEVDKLDFEMTEDMIAKGRKLMELCTTLIAKDGSVLRQAAFKPENQSWPGEWPSLWAALIKRFDPDNLEVFLHKETKWMQDGHRQVYVNPFIKNEDTGLVTLGNLATSLSYAHKIVVPKEYEDFQIAHGGKLLEKMVSHVAPLIGDDAELLIFEELN